MIVENGEKKNVYIKAVRNKSFPMLYAVLYLLNFEKTDKRETLLTENRGRSQKYMLEMLLN